MFDTVTTDTESILTDTFRYGTRYQQNNFLKNRYLTGAIPLSLLLTSHFKINNLNKLLEMKNKIFIVNESTKVAFVTFSLCILVFNMNTAFVYNKYWNTTILLVDN